MSDELFSYAIRLLSQRAYPEAMLRQKLERKGPSQSVEAVMQRIRSMGFLNDAAYAEGYVRLYQNKWGSQKLRQQLLLKGLSAATIHAALQSQIEQDPHNTALELLQRYARRHQNDKAKAVRFLVGRGFAIGEALEAFRRYQEQGQAD